jgi:hypothetical protein
MLLKPGKIVVKLRLALCEEVDVIEMSGKFRGNVEAWGFHRFNHICWRVNESGTYTFFDAKLFR